MAVETGNSRPCVSGSLSPQHFGRWRGCRGSGQCAATEQVQAVCGCRFQVPIQLFAAGECTHSLRSNTPSITHDAIRSSPVSPAKKVSVFHDRANLQRPTRSTRRPALFNIAPDPTANVHRQSFGHVLILLKRKTHKQTLESSKTGNKREMLCSDAGFAVLSRH